MPHPQQLPGQALPHQTPATQQQGVAYHTTNYYNVNHIEQAHNMNTGTNYGHVSQSSYENSYPGLSHAPSLGLNRPSFTTPIPDAGHSRNRRTSPPDSSCLPGTRQGILQDIRSWLDSDLSTESDHVFWLCGPVGCGKSAISQAVAEEYEGKGRLLASFFFFRGAGDRSKIGRFFATLACQMAQAMPRTAKAVEKALKSFDLEGASLKTQLHRLLFVPFQEAVSESEREAQTNNAPAGRRRKRAKTPAVTNPTKAFLIVIDGLDECEDRPEVEQLITDVLDLFKQNPHLPLRFMIASRVEEHIRARIENTRVHIENLNDHYSEEDINTLVRHTFKQAAKNNLVIRSYGEEWPPEDDTQELIQHADGSFIFITTLLKFILGLEASRDDGMTPMERFKLALDMNPGLDGLYSETLQRAHHISHFKDVVLTVALVRTPPGLSISSLARLLGIPPFKVVNVLIPLQAIISVPGDDLIPVTMFHTSLKDFIRDEGRSTDIFSSADRDAAHTRLARWCFQARLTPGPESDEPTPERSVWQYAQDNWTHHWTELRRPMEHHIDFLITFAQQKVPRPDFQIAFKTYLGTYRQARLHGETAGDEDIEHVPKPLSRISGGEVSIVWGTLLWSARHDDDINSDLELLKRLYQEPATRPDSSTHRCIVMHSMHALLRDGGDAANHPTILDRCYMVEHCAHHLALSIQTNDDADDAALLDFLRVPYQVPISPHPHKLPWSGVYPVSRKVLRSNIDRAIQAIDRKFPGLQNSNPWVEDIPGFSLYTIHRKDGLALLDMLNIFRALLQPPEWSPKQRSVDVHCPDGFVVRFSLIGANADQEGDDFVFGVLNPYKSNLYH